MAGKLFEYVILYHPKANKEQREAGTTPPSQILQAPKFLLAVDQNKALMLAVRDVPEEYLDRLEEVEVLIRPF